MRTWAFLHELDTLEQAHAGRSISRFGDGELKIATGRDAKSQQFSPGLQARLCEILKAPPGPCLVCIPIAAPGSPKTALWNQYQSSRYTGLYRAGATYGSAFITRPDSAPWIDTEAYWRRVTDLWRGKDVVLVRGSSKSLTAADLFEAKSVREMICPRQHAWGESPVIFRRLKGETRPVLLCLGATASVLAYDLAQIGVWALDLGHIGMFMRREGRFDRESFPP